jgi:hypothetical protein
MGAGASKMEQMEETRNENGESETHLSASRYATRGTQPSYDTNDPAPPSSPSPPFIVPPVAVRGQGVEVSNPGQPPLLRAIYVSVLFKRGCYSISTQLVNALLFNRVARRRAGSRRARA